MKLHEDYVLCDMGDEWAIVPVGTAAEHFHGIFQANGSAGAILSCLREETTLEAILDTLEARYDAPREALEAAVRELLEQLRTEGLLRE